MRRRDGAWRGAWAPPPYSNLGYRPNQGGFTFARREAEPTDEQRREAHRPLSSDLSQARRADQAAGIRPPAGDFRAMLEIIIVLLAALGMARKGRGKRGSRFRKYLRGSVDEGLLLTTIGANSLLSSDFDETVNERAFVSSIVASWSLANWTDIANAGPILVGIAHSDYTSSEIEAVIENTGSWNEGSLVEQEIAKRKIRIVGQFSGAASAADAQVLNDGKPIRTKCGWILNQGQTLKVWAYNTGTVAVATTVPFLHVQGHANLWPR